MNLKKSEKSDLEHNGLITKKIISKTLPKKNFYKLINDLDKNLNAI